MKKSDSWPQGIHECGRQRRFHNARCTLKLQVPQIETDARPKHGRKFSTSEEAPDVEPGRARNDTLNPKP